MQDSSQAPTKKKLASFDYIFKKIIWPRRWLLLLGLLLIVLNRVAGLVLPGSTKFLLDDIIDKQQIEMLFPLLGVVGLAVTVQSITSYSLTKLLSVEAQHLIALLRIEVQKQVLNLPVGFYDNNKSGALVSRIMRDVEGVRNLVGTGLVQLFGGILTSIVALIILLNINAELTLYAILPMIAFALISLKAFSYIRPIFRERGAINADVTGRLTESLNGIRVIKGFHAEAQEAKVFATGALKIFNNVKKTLTSTSLVTSSATLLLGIASITIMGVSGTKILAQEMTVGDFVAFTLYLGFMTFPIIQMSNIGSQITEALAGLDRTEELLNQPRENEDGARSVKLPEVVGNIEFEGISFAYQADKEVLHDISFSAPAGSITALVGSSGSGKSTIAGLAASFLDPTGGRITVDQKDLSQVQLSSYRQHLGVVLQDDFLFEGTIRENILFPKPDASEEELQQAVSAAYVSEFTDRFEDGLDTLIGERGVKLSGGQRQRIAIARAILSDPRILILDEATSNLDTESESYIQQSLAQLMQGRTTFVIAHRLSTIRQAHQILVVENGNIVERGTHDQLLAKEGRYHKLYTYQSRI